MPDILKQLIDDDSSDLIRDAAAEIAALRAEKRALGDIVGEIDRRLEWASDAEFFAGIIGAQTELDRQADGGELFYRDRDGMIDGRIDLVALVRSILHHALRAKAAESNRGPGPESNRGAPDAAPGEPTC